MNSNEQLSSVEIGERLKVARETSKVKQEDAATRAGIARTTLVSIEKGQRAAKIEELQVLSLCYGVSVNSLLRKEAVHVDLVPRFRRVADADQPEVEEAAQLLNDLVKAEVELENLVGISRQRNYPQEKMILTGDVRLQAEQDAQDLRRWLGIGDGPIQDLFALIELQMGVRIYVRKLHPKISGLFAFDDSVGACILINSSHSRQRRNQSGGHELGHFTATRRVAEVYEDEKYENSREERYANAFGRAFLMPARFVMQKFKEITAGSSHLTRRHVIILAHFFDVSRQAAVMRLEELQLTKRGTWDWFVDNGNITDEHVRQVLGDRAALDDGLSESPRPSIRLESLATQAAQKGLVSEEQLVRLLKLPRTQVRAILEEAESGKDEVNDLFKLS
ncbi:transcriptional regulator [Mesorhizobium sp. LSJC285A00]|uniref:helix-turn-helix domain-containing protein n=1 Tax=Mesorhizobium sp. LSJC285A00 TaxID=1287338 RepID=UPI0003CE7FC2|nr:XRE family transcriptional regulator [Mesorhizobium sp. LSJC285A00]ESW78196.1 transcriptional regulator [Mesorhizobium sp. LSJC285A00]